jgi:hypothetical protein
MLHIGADLFADMAARASDSGLSTRVGSASRFRSGNKL